LEPTFIGNIKTVCRKLPKPVALRVKFLKVTDATILGRNCSMTQIMAVTGHKSALSVAVYQRVSSKEKQVMGDIITSSVRGEQLSQLSSIMPPHSTSRLQLD
jgi:hypothetical protein